MAEIIYLQSPISKTVSKKSPITETHHYDSVISLNLSTESEVERIFRFVSTVENGNYYYYFGRLLFGKFEYFLDILTLGKFRFIPYVDVEWYESMIEKIFYIPSYIDEVIRKDSLIETQFRIKSLITLSKGFKSDINNDGGY